MRAFNHLSKICTAVIAVVVTLVPAAKMHAQVSPIAVTVNVPFEFDAGSLHFASGQYTMWMAQNRVLAIRRGEHVVSMEVGLGEDRNQFGAQGKVVFRHYGNHYFLSEVRSSKDSEYIVCFGSKAERQARRQELALNRSLQRSAETGNEVALVESAK